MNLQVVGCSHRSAPVDVREKLAFAEDQLADALKTAAERFAGEAVLLSTCNRVELYIAREAVPSSELKDYLGLARGLSKEQIQKNLYVREGDDAVRHLFRVTASLDSLVVGEGQIAAQVRKAYEAARLTGSTGPLLNILFPTALRSAKRARTETGIAQGHVSVSSVAVDYVRQVFDHFDDKTVLLIGAGKMGRLTLKHLQELKPKAILVVNRSLEKAEEVAAGCGGMAYPWDKLDYALGRADIVLSTTGSPEIVVDRRRYDAVRIKREGRVLVILDIAVPRDFDPAIHDGETTFLFNIDDLTRVREQTLAQRQRHIAPAEQIVEAERKKFQEDWTRRQNGPLIAQLTGAFENRRAAALEHLFAKLNAKLTEADRAYIEGAFRLFQNQLLHGPIDALKEAARDGSGTALSDAVRKMFKL